MLFTEGYLSTYIIFWSYYNSTFYIKTINLNYDFHWIILYANANILYKFYINNKAKIKNFQNCNIIIIFDGETII